MHGQIKTVAVLKITAVVGRGHRTRFGIWPLDVFVRQRCGV